MLAAAKSATAKAAPASHSQPQPAEAASPKLKKPREIFVWEIVATHLLLLLVIILADGEQNIWSKSRKVYA